MKPVVSLQRVSYRYLGAPDDETAIADVTFDIWPGEMVAIIGSNGAGKTTLSKLLNGLLEPSQGQISICGQNTVSTPTSKLAQHVGMLFQNPDHQICQTSVHDEIAFTLRLRGLSDEQIELRTAQAEQGFELDGEADPFTLSRGDRQCLALASVLAAHPDILILDEPTNGLDGRTRSRVMRQVLAAQGSGCAVIMITHDMELTLDTACRVLVMEQGHLIADGTPDEVFRDADIMGAASLLPPQIIDLSQRIAHLEAEAGSFDTVSSVSEMVTALQNRLDAGKEVERA